MEIAKKDWMLFRERIGVWQETYPEELEKTGQAVSGERLGIFPSTLLKT